MILLFPSFAPLYQPLRSWLPEVSYWEPFFCSSYSPWVILPIHVISTAWRLQILISRAFLPPQLQVHAPLWGCFRKVPNRTFIKLKSQNILPFSVGISVNGTNVHSVAQAKAWVILVSFLSLPLYIKLIIKSYWLCLFRCTWICWLVFVIYATPLVHHLPATLQPWLSNSSAFH